jgi:hypothetical protein
VIRGIDLSQHQPTTPDLSGLGFVVLRASIGTSVDERYGQHYVAARAAGITVMAYAYGIRNDREAIADQVAVFLSVAAAADYLWLDQEETGFTDAQATDFIAKVRAAGRPCGLYHSSSGFGGVPADAQWVADWRAGSVEAGYPKNTDATREFPGWDLWQYNGAGADGIDNDYANPAWPLPAPRYFTAEAVAALQADCETRIRNVTEGFVARLADKDTQIAYVKAQLAAAPGIERERIAQAVSARIREV